MTSDSPTPLADHHWDKETEPVLSVFVWTYNDVNFIAECIESILMQRTTFPVEVIIHDDASTDGTADVIRQFDLRHPNIFRNIYQTVNQWSGDGVMQPLLTKPRGKYIALSHGDDYWTDPLKLQKQVDFLEANPDYVMVGHDAIVIDANGKQVANSVYIKENHKRDLTKEELTCVAAAVPTLTRCYRNVIASFPPEFGLVANGDTFLSSILGAYGKCKYLDESMAAYRRHAGGVASGTRTAVRIGTSKNTNRQLSRYHRRIGNDYAYRSFLKVKMNLNRQHLYYSIQEKNAAEFRTAAMDIFMDDRLWLHPKNLFIHIKTVLRFYLS